MQNTHTYPLGGRIDLAAAPANGPRGPYEITALLPEAPDGEPQYAIRSEAGVERVVTEAEILTLRSGPVAEPAEAPEEPVSKAKNPAQAEREAEARSAWKDYIDEREAIIRRTAELRALRLKAEAEAAEKIMRLAKSVAAKAGKPTGKAASKPGKPALAPKAKPLAAAAKPAAKEKPAPKPVAAKPAAPKAKPAAASKPASKPVAAKPAAPKPAVKAPAKPSAKAKAPAKTKAPVKAAAKAVKKAPVRAAAKPKMKAAKPKAKSKAR